MVHTMGSRFSVAKFTAWAIGLFIVLQFFVGSMISAFLFGAGIQVSLLTLVVTLLVFEAAILLLMLSIRSFEGTKQVKQPQLWRPESPAKGEETRRNEISPGTAKDLVKRPPLKPRTQRVADVAFLIGVAAAAIGGILFVIEAQNPRAKITLSVVIDR